MDFHRFSGIVGPIWEGQIKLPIYFKILYGVILDVEHDKRTIEKFYAGVVFVFCEKQVFTYLCVTFGAT